MTRLRLALCVFLGGLVLASCGQPGSQSAGGSTTVLNRGNGAEPKSLDPDYIDGIWESQIVGDLLIGLTQDDASGRPIPGVAETWETSEDGLTWTFHLRDSQWSDGMPVTADDFVFAWRRILAPETAAMYAYYLYPVKNAKAVNEGKMPGTELGIAAPDARTVVVTLENPTPFLPGMLTHQTAVPLPRHVVEANPKGWAKAGNYVANGPYVLKEWVPNDHVTLEKNPKFYEADTVKIETVNYYPTPDADAALRRLRAGELDTQDPIPPTQIDWLRANMAETLKIEPSLVTSYIAINLRHKPLDNPLVRAALSLAYDRETMVNNILKLGQVPAYSLVPPTMSNYPHTAHLAFKDMPFAERLKKAQDLMRDAGYGPDKMLTLSLATTTNGLTKLTVAPLQQMWRAIYVDLQVVQSDTQINYQKLQEGDFDVGVAGWVADYDDASNFLDVLRTGGGNNYSRYANPKYDALLDQAAAEGDLAKRGEILSQAEQMLLDDNPVIVTRHEVTTAVVQPYVKGWVPNGKELNRTRWLSIER